MKQKQRRSMPSISEGSLADIAFLLLIFFLVSTTINVDEGILVRLPPYEESTDVPKVADRNLFRVFINAEKEVLADNAIIPIQDLSDALISFLMNYGVDPTLSVSPKKAVTSIHCERNVSYQMYLEVYNEIIKGYNHCRNIEAKIKYGVSYKACNLEQQKLIRSIVPKVISEAELTKL